MKQFVSTMVDSRNINNVGTMVYEKGIFLTPNMLVELASMLTGECGTLPNTPVLIDFQDGTHRITFKAPANNEYTCLELRDEPVTE